MIGVTLYSDCDLRTDWFDRQADNIILFAEEIAVGIDIDSTISLTIQLYHKDRDDAGDGAPVGSPITLDAGVLKFKYAQIEGLKQLVRVQLSLAAFWGGDPSNYSFGWIHFRLLTPIWYDSAAV